MKPSERIKEIAESKKESPWYGEDKETQIMRFLNSVVQYLDEEYEKGKENEQFNKDFAVHDATSKLQ